MFGTVINYHGLADKDPDLGCSCNDPSIGIIINKKNKMANR